MSKNGKVAIVTGAGGGVGKAITRRLSHEGCRVVLVGRDRAKLSKVVAESKDNKNLLADRKSVV